MSGRSLIGSAVIKITGDKTGFDAVLSQVRARLQSFGRDLQQLGYKLLAAGAAIQAPLTLAAQQFASYGTAINAAAKRAGMAAEEFAELSHVAKMSEVGPQIMETALVAMQRGLVDATRDSGNARKALDVLGLSAKDLIKLPVAEQFEAIAEAVSKFDPAMQPWLTLNLFGRGSRELIPVLKIGREGVKQYRMEFQRLFGVHGQPAFDNAEKLSNMYERVKTTLQGLAFSVGEILAPAFIKIATYLTNFIAHLRQFIQDNPQVVTGIQTIAMTLTILGAAFVGLGVAIRGLSVLVSPGGVLLVLAGVLLYISGALDPIIDKIKDWADNTVIGGKTITEWIGMVGDSFSDLWTAVKDSLGAFWPTVKAFGNLFLETFKLVWAEIGYGFHLMITAIGTQMAALLRKTSEAFLDLSKSNWFALVPGGKQAVAGLGAAFAHAELGLVSQRRGPADLRKQAGGVAEHQKATFAAAEEFSQQLNLSLGKQKGIWQGNLDEPGTLEKLKERWGDAFAPIIEKGFGEKQGNIGILDRIGSYLGLKGLGKILTGLGQPFPEPKIPAPTVVPGPAMQIAMAASGTFSGLGASLMAGQSPALQIAREQLAVLRDIRDNTQDSGEGGYGSGGE